MNITFASKKLKKQADSEKNLILSFGKEKAEKIKQRLLQLSAAKSLKDIAKMPQTGFHPLVNNRKRQYSIYSKQPYRIIFVATETSHSENLEFIKDVKIVDLNLNYHKK